MSESMTPATSPQGGTPIGVWLQAARPRTLGAAAVPVAVATAAAWVAGSADFLIAFLALLGAFLIQVGTNFANDYFDFIKGADTEERIGPTRITQAGLASPRAVLIATIIVFAMAAGVGVFLVLRGGMPIMVLGLVSILCGVLYTGGPFPLGYNGLGDIFVFLFFGLAAVVGTWWLQTLTWSWWVFSLAVPVGFLSTALIVVNNLRDAATDARSGKRTLAVIFGEKFARREYAILVIASYLWLAGMAIAGGGLWYLLPLLSLPLAIPLLRAISKESGPVLNQRLGETGRLLVVFGLLMSIGIALGG